jgi:hypothetical protein
MSAAEQSTGFNNVKMLADEVSFRSHDCFDLLIHTLAYQHKADKVAVVHLHLSRIPPLHLFYALFREVVTWMR